MKTYLVYIFIFISAIISSFVVANYIFPHAIDDCGRNEVYTGHLYGWYQYPYYLNLSNKAFYVSEWYVVDGNPPNDLNNYFGHPVEISTYEGCGRVLVNHIKILF